jgi:hypothetical protein
MQNKNNKQKQKRNSKLFALQLNFNTIALNCAPASQQTHARVKPEG